MKRSALLVALLALAASACSTPAGSQPPPTAPAETVREAHLTVQAQPDGPDTPYTVGTLIDRDKYPTATTFRLRFRAILIATGNGPVLPICARLVDGAGAPVSASETCGSVTEAGVTLTSPSFAIPAGVGEYRMEWNVANTTFMGPVDLIATW